MEPTEVTKPQLLHLEGESVDLSKRGFMKRGFLLSVLASSGGVVLSGCSDDPFAHGYKWLQPNDLILLERITRVILGGALPNDPAIVQRYLLSWDDLLTHFSQATQSELRLLFNVLHNPLVRGPSTGIWGGWSSASEQSVSNFLQRWKNSSLEEFRIGQAALLQLSLMAWYGMPEAWPPVGYPGIPYRDVLVTEPNDF